MKKCLILLSACLLFGALAKPAPAQETQEEEQFKFALSVLVMCMNKLTQGDNADASRHFPKDAFGQFTKGIYQVTRDGFIQGSVTYERLARTKEVDVKYGFYYYSSPTAALREIRQITKIYSESRIQWDRIQTRYERVFEEKDADPGLLKMTKSEARKSFKLMKDKEAKKKDFHLLNLILWSRLEDLYYFLELHRKEYDPFGLHLEIRPNKLLDLEYRQKYDAVRKAVKELQALLDKQAKEDPYGPLRNILTPTNG